MIDGFTKPLETIVTTLIARHDRKEDRERVLADKKAESLRLLYQTLTTTVGYVETLPGGADRQKEMALATGWADAMMSCRPFFEDEDVFWMWRKSISWLEGDNLSPEELRRLKIDLPTVRRKVSDMVMRSHVENIRTNFLSVTVLANNGRRCRIRS